MKRIILALTALLISTSAWATVPSATPLYSQYSCNSSTTQFPYTFQISSTGDIQVYVNDNAGTITQEATSTYSVDTSNVWVNYPLSGSPCPTGSTLTLIPATPQTQLLSLTNRSPFVGSAIGSALDKLTLISQQLQGQLNRAILAPAGTSAFTFPSAVSGNILGWDSAGSGNIVNYVPNTSTYLTKAVLADSQTATNDSKYMTPAQVANEVNYASSSVISIPANNLAGSIPDSKLSTISTAGKVNTSAITVGGAIATAQGGTGSTSNSNSAGGVVLLNGSSQLPAVSGALLTTLPGVSTSIGSIARDLTATSGSVAYTGIGFTPKVLIVFSALSAGASWSNGAGIVGTSMDTYVVADGTAVNGSSELIHVGTASGAYQTATISSFDADGFTLSWTKTGSPTGTATCRYVALR